MIKIKSKNFSYVANSHKYIVVWMYDFSISFVLLLSSSKKSNIGQHYKN